MTYFDKVRVVIFTRQNRVRSRFIEFTAGSILTYFDNVHVVICDHQNRVRSMFLEFLLIVVGGQTPDKRIPDGLF